MGQSSPFHLADELIAELKQIREGLGDRLLDLAVKPSPRGKGLACLPSRVVGGVEGLLDEDSGEGVGSGLREPKVGPRVGRGEEDDDGGDGQEDEGELLHDRLLRQLIPTKCRNFH